MADARLEIKAGHISFTGEGTEEWLAKQLDKVLGKLPQLAQPSSDDTESGTDGSDGGATEGWKEAKRGF
jgi:hypothetical protein